MGLAELVEWAIEHLDYWVVFVLMILENSVVPLPAELIVTPAAYNAANGEMSAALLILVTTVGSTIGAIINYYLSLWVGRPAIHHFAETRLGRLCGLNRHRLERAEDLFRRKGNLSTFIGRILPAGRQFISIPAGLASMNIAAFIFFTFIGSALWNSILVAAGYYLSYLLPPEEIAPTIEHYGMQINIVFFSIIGAVIAYYAIRARLRRRNQK